MYEDQQADLLVLQARPPKLLRVTSDGTEIRTVIDYLGGTPDGIATDPASGHVYWTNMGDQFDQPDGTIERSSLDGSDRVTLVGGGATVTPKQIALDLAGGRIYWCDREGMRVMRCRLDGSDVETLVKRGRYPEDMADETRHCIGIAVDTVQGLVYWTQKGPDNGGQGRIFRAPINLPDGATPEDRADIETLADGLPEPIDLHLSHDGQSLLWTDRGAPPLGNTLNSATISRRGLTDARIIADGFREAIGLASAKSGDIVFVGDLGGDIAAVDQKSGRKTIIASMGSITGLTLSDVRTYSSL